ncbi:hypothetical protein [uncultured Albimonas sp.]|uniref:hypothetical protein n=1 Tax=uncultured Albimonas sp. TaxID=1331701 RepID=UPI0030ED3CF5|tara:strand:- start:1953 stop:2855 length:903 start_codon:yes stop_codon:yes gene_type:complete
MATNPAIAGMTGEMSMLNGLTPIGEPYRIGRWHRDLFARHGYVHELGAAVKRALKGRRDGPRFVIYGRARSGSTLLVKLLEQIPDIHCRGEALHFGVLGPRAHLNRLADLRKAPVHGCKLLSYQLVEVQRMRSVGAFMQGLAEDGFVLIHLTRGTLAQATSLSVAQQTDRYHAARESISSRAPVRLDPETFVRQTRMQLGLLEMERAALAGLPTLEVRYERDLLPAEAHQGAVDRICARLGARSQPVRSPLRKLLPIRFEEVVANADEVREAMLRAGLDDVFDEAEAHRHGLDPAAIAAQ